MIGRNEPCPCGSGKKYKKCCAKKESVTNEQLVQEETERVLRSYFESGLQNNVDFNKLDQYGREWKRKIGQIDDKEDSENTMLDAYMFIEREDLWNRHLMKWLNTPLRPVTRKILESWRQPIVLLAKVTSVKAGRIICEQLLEDSMYEFDQMAYMEVPPKEGYYLFSIALRDKELSENGIRIIDSLNQFLSPNNLIESKLSKMAEESGLLNSREFYRTHFADIYKMINGVVEMTLEELVEPDQLQAFVLLEEQLKAHGGGEVVLEFGPALLMAYYKECNPVVRKHEGVAAAAFKVLYDQGLLGAKHFTQKDIAALFGISVSSMTKHIDPMYEILNKAEDEMVTKEQPQINYQIGLHPYATERMNWEMYRKSVDHEFESMEALNQYFMEEGNRSYIPKSDADRAQMLCYEAYAAFPDVEKGEVLIREAAKLDPESVDVHLFLAELSTDVKDAESLIKKAVQLGEKTFEPVEISWALVTNRPYMRALFMLGVLQYEEDRFGEAAACFEKLVEINPNDQQGAHYLAISARLRDGNWKRADELIQMYESELPDPTLSFLNWKLELSRNEGWNSKVESLFEKAKLENPYVNHIIENDMPKFPYPDHLAIEPGSFDEAMYIWSLL
ncbi:hypothetical protein NCCP2222_19890 [Sporosarcina sp. NCCP-2222]|uniref:SEC-C metal-binding domain-containing protein n=1 Tax=Sporosarcina sp. NCCP-2222 TaxID=2935073 RepID=UPI00207E1DEA|nr:SEC-C metal-binding domain-containing protein [Sporosarcina sp. NCCP-2222]GKV56042.1 hypothetical protein NCCP2222_19890 [Sporosarcina sp. NCCP-2222]